MNQNFDLNSRSSPSLFDPRGTGLGNRNVSIIDNARRAQFERATRTQIENQRRQRSPLTPPLGEMSPAHGANGGPYFFLKAEQQEEHIPYEDMYALEDCQGVYLDDNGPLFSNGHGGHMGLGGEGGGGNFHGGTAAGPAVSSLRL